MGPPGRPEQSDSGGFRAFLYVVIGAALIAISLIFVGLGVLASDPRSEGWFDAAGNFLRATYQGQFAPAAVALREAGCQQAFMIPAKDAQALAEAFGTHAGPEFGESPFVQCRMILPAGGDTCATMARVAAGASDPVPSELIVNVDGLGACRGVYAPDGSLIRALDGGE